MWNKNIKRGSIWSVKSYNQYEDENYLGMSLNTSYVLILSYFLDNYNVHKFTYLKATYFKKPNKLYTEINFKGEPLYIDIEFLHTGQQECLEFYKGCIDYQVVNNIVDLTKDYFNLKHEKPINLSKKVILQNTTVTTDLQQKIYKFGINIFVTPSNNVKITNSNRIILSDIAKKDILQNSFDEEHIQHLCNKYKIYPTKAIREIKNRLVYQYKNK